MGLAKSQPVGILTTDKLRETSGHIFCPCCRKQVSMLAATGRGRLTATCSAIAGA